MRPVTLRTRPFLPIKPLMVVMPRAVRWAYAGLCAWLAAAALRNAFAPDLEFGPLFHRYAHDVALVVAGLLCLARIAASPQERLPWALIGAGILSWTAGEVYYTSVLWTAQEIPFPSPADAGYLLMPPLVLTGAMMLLHRRHPGLPTTVRVDALTAALAVSALSASLVVGTVKDSVADGLGAATMIAYPVADLVIGGCIVGAVAAIGRRAGRTWLLLGVGIVAFWVADSLYLLAVADGRYLSPSWFDAGWWIGLTLVSLAAWQPSGAEHSHGGLRRERLRDIAVPLAFATTGLVVLVAGASAQMDPVAVMLAAGAMIAVMGRLALTFRENLAMLEHSRDEALTDALTGLPNRRALTRELERAIAVATDEKPVVLVLFDLDGFKAYNDSFGHPAGDGLLIRLGASLERYLEGRGHAFRMGGDEFCALLEPGTEIAEPIIAGAGRALSEHGEGFSIGCSYGSIFLPREAATTAEALRIADQRMYAQKSAGRASAGRQSSDVLLRALAERNPRLSSHLSDVAELAEAVGRRLGLPDEQLGQLRLAAELHDVGKVAIPDAILDKPGPLDEDEWVFMRRHTLIGERIIAAAPALQPVAALVRSSHERWDGRGYPDALAGRRIPLGARIVAVADAFDAMVSDRPYGIARSPRHALDELRRCSGSQFDPVVVEAFCEVWDPDAAPAQTTAGAGAGR